MNKQLVQRSAALHLDDDPIVPEDLVGRLYGASESAVADLVADYSPDQRANLAMFFYRKAHLRPIGLAIAATCDFPTLVQAWGLERGQALFDRSHHSAPASASPSSPARPRITLARSATFHLASVASVPDEEEVDRIAA